MAAESNLKNMALCLTLVCLFCSAVLAAVYVVTKDPIERTNANILKESIGTVLPPGGDLSEERPLEVGGLPSVYYVNSSAGMPAAYAIKSSTVGFSGPLTLMVGITADGKIYNTSVLSHSETPGLGAKCATDEPFIMQFKGFDPAEKILAVKKDGGDLDAITASTITSRAYALAIQNALAAFQTIKGE